jgi:hypothetical protein
MDSRFTSPASNGETIENPSPFTSAGENKFDAGQFAVVVEGKFKTFPSSEILQKLSEGKFFASQLIWIPAQKKKTAKPSPDRRAPSPSRRVYAKVRKTQVLTSAD